LKVLGTPWFDPQHPIINADNFLDFSYRPLRSNANNTVSCVPCGPGLDCSSATDKPPAAGFHGGIVVDKGFWRVDWALDAATLAARCRNTNACERGGRCASEFKTGPLCEVCKVGYGMRAGVCVDCDRQDFLPVVIIGGLLVVVVTLLIVFRKVLHEFRAVWWSIGRIFKVLIDCAQIVGAMPGVLGNIDWPEELQGLFSILDFFSLDMTQYIGLACLDGKETNYYQKSGMMLIFVSIVLAAAFIAFRVSICRKQQWWSTKATAEEKELFIEEVLEEEFELADIEDSGKLSFVEAKAVARRVGNAKIESLLIKQMFKERKVKGRKSFASELIEENNSGKGTVKKVQTINKSPPPTKSRKKRTSSPTNSSSGLATLANTKMLLKSSSSPTSRSPNSKKKRRSTPAEEAEHEAAYQEFLLEQKEKARQSDEGNNNNSNDDSPHSKKKGSLKSKKKKRRSTPTSTSLFARGEKLNQQRKDIAEYKEEQETIYLYRKEFVKFMKNMDSIGSIVLRAERKEKLQTLMTFFMPFMLILHTPVTGRIFALFACDPIGGGGLKIRSTGRDVYNGAGTADADDLSQRLTLGFLPADYKLACMDFTQPGNSTAVLFYVLCFLLLALVTVGIPLGLMVYMFRHRHSFYTYKTYSEIGYLYARFRRGSEFCDLHILVYKTLLCGFIIFFRPWPRLQHVVGLSICMCYGFWFAWTKPMRNPVVTRVCLYGFCVTSFVYASTQIFADASTDESIKMLFVYLIIATKIGLICVCCIGITLIIKLARKTVHESMLNKKASDDCGIGSDVVAVGASGLRYSGKVRYIGEIPGKVGEFIGLELETDRGKNDGRGLFACKPNHGLFVKREAIVEVVHSQHESKAAKRRSKKHQQMRMLSSTVVVPFEKGQLGKMSQSMMEHEIIRLQKQSVNQSEEISRLNGIFGLK